jgi:hypothetical protein
MRTTELEDLHRRHVNNADQLERGLHASEHHEANRQA